MALDYTPSDIASGFQTTESLDQNFADIQEALQDGLSRSGQSPNAMGTDLDMQGHRVYNLPNAVRAGEPVTYSQLFSQTETFEFAGYLQEVQTADPGQTVFELFNSYTLGLGGLRVFVNGLLYPSSEYLETDQNTITFLVPLEGGDEVHFVITSFTEADYDTASTVQYQNSEGSYESVQYKLDHFFPITSEEIAASVTPLNYDYPPTNVLRYGAVGDNSTDNTDAFDACESLSYSTFYLPDGAYLTTHLVLEKSYIGLGSIEFDDGYIQNGYPPAIEFPRNYSGPLKLESSSDIILDPEGDVQLSGKKILQLGEATADDEAPNFGQLRSIVDSLYAEVTTGVSYAIFGHAVAPHFQAVKISPEGSEILPVDVPFNNSVFAVAVSPEGKYVVVGGGSEGGSPSKHIKFYQVTRDGLEVLPWPVDLPGSDVYGLDFSPCGNYLAVAHTASGGRQLIVYKIQEGEFVKLTDPDQPAATGYSDGISWSNSNDYLAYPFSASPYLVIYKRISDTFTKLDLPTLPVASGRKVAWSPDDTLLAMPTAVSPYLNLLARNGEKFSLLPSPSTPPTGLAWDAAFSPDGTMLAIAHGTSPFVSVYLVNNGELTKLPDPADLPAGTGRSVEFDASGQFLYVGHETTPFLTTYQVVDGELIKVTNPLTLPGTLWDISILKTWKKPSLSLEIPEIDPGVQREFVYFAALRDAGNPSVPTLCWYEHSEGELTRLPSPNEFTTNSSFSVAPTPGAGYLYLGHGASPYNRWYKRTGDVLTQLAAPSPGSVGDTYAASFSPDGNYLAVAYLNTPGDKFIIFRRNGDVLEKLTNPTQPPDGYCEGLRWSASGNYVAYVSNISPGVRVYKRTGDSFSLITFPTISDSTRDVAWGADDRFLVAAVANSPYIRIYSRSGEVFTALSNPASLPAGDSWGVDFSPDGHFLAVGHATSPYLTVYSVSGSTFTKLADPASLPAGRIRSLKFSSSGQYIFLAVEAAPYLMVYKIVDGVLVKQADPADQPSYNGYDIAVANYPDVPKLSLPGHSHSAGDVQTFPVGALYLTVVNTNPSTLLGYGTWASFSTGIPSAYGWERTA